MPITHEVECDNRELGKERFAGLRCVRHDLTEACGSSCEELLSNELGND